MAVHSTALVAAGARLADDVEIGPYTLIGPQVTIGAGCRIAGHVVITGRTTLGRNNRVFQFASLGDEPQDKKYQGEDTALVIGDGNTIREMCTINRGTVQGGGTTRLGDDNWLMACVHVAHDCQVGDHTIFANNAAIAGHVSIGDYAIISGYSLVHQFCVVGAHSLLSFGSHINQSVPPYVVVSSDKAKPRGVNVEGLKRRGYSAAQIARLRRAYRLIYRDKLPLDELRTALDELAAEGAEIEPLIAFFAAPERSILR